MKYRFFHWSCDTCGVAGGVQLKSNTSPDTIISECQSSHDENEECDGDVLVDEINEDSL